ncbi:MotA/TolQ/ExbB proton channel family protein [Pseudooceanicola aestuarii]|uniref:MotA/TolQ/ExbB proton channel family protein n=1 Tax=Pseudooceanicola aestuarii TaxID=2697319 RepID=UPI001EF8B5E4|nr:MotA/TolQ/ExbB proton channel family protein [Pseudooceanicola aestuarii]
MKNRFLPAFLITCVMGGTAAFGQEPQGTEPPATGGFSAGETEALTTAPTGPGQTAPAEPAATDAAPAQDAASALAYDPSQSSATTDTTVASDLSEASETTEAIDATGREAEAEPEGQPDAPVRTETPETTETLAAAAQPETLEDRLTEARTFLIDGGPAIWAIAGLSVITLALILWKTWRLSLAGAWSWRVSARAVDAWEAGDAATAQALVATRRSLRSRMTRAALHARLTLPEASAREEVQRVAKLQLAAQSSGLRALELIATIAPLLGLLGTVMGMISAFQALQEAGNRADPALLAGGIWEALLTTAAGMAVAIPASVALTWFESVLDRVRTDLENIATRIFIAPLPAEAGATVPDRVAAE